MNKILFLITLLFIQSCSSIPTSSTLSNQDKAALTFKLADKETKGQIYINNVKMGKVEDYSVRKNKALSVRPGVNRVRIIVDGKTIYNKKLYLGSDIVKTISLF